MSNLLQEVKDRVSKIKNTHKFLANELLVPNLDKTDGVRIQMFNSNIIQSLVLNDMDTPNVFTRFENEIGEHSNSYLKSERDYEIIEKIYKNSMNYCVILKSGNYIDIKFIKPSEHLTQRFGYIYNDNIKDKKKGDIIKKGDLIYRSPAYDDYLNFKYGKNLKAIYMSFKHLQYEDAIIISDEAAEKLANHNVDTVEISLNNNDLLINNYGDENEYKCLPDVGEKLDSCILTARRRVNKNSILYNLTTERLSTIDFSNDTVFYVDDNSIVTDIEVYCNGDISKLRTLPYYKQIMKYYDINNEYYEKIVNVLESYIDNNDYECSDDVKFYYNRYKRIPDPEYKWRLNKNIYDNVILRVKTISYNPLQIGSKITAR